MNGPHPSRRRLLAGLGVTLSSALAGCSETLAAPFETASTPTPPEYDHLEQTTLYVAPAVPLSLPDGVQHVSDPVTADLVVLPATTDVAADTAIDWLVDGRGIALLGATSESTFHRWTGSDAYYEAFEPPHGRSDATPDPELLVAFAVDRQFISTHRYTWGHTDEPSNAEVLESLEEALRDEATRTPHD